MTSKAEWYAIRTSPGYQRMAATNPSLPDNRRGESAIERNMREKGIDIYMPSFWVETKHRRTNAIIERRFPLLVGYAFVLYDDAKGFDPIRAINGVMCILKMGREGAPVKFHEDDIGALKAAEFFTRQDYLYQQHCRNEDDRLGKVAELRKRLKTILPKGRAVRVSMTDQAVKAIETLQGPARERVLGILNELNALTSEPPLAGNEQITYSRAKFG